MNIKRILSAMLIAAMLSVNGVCVPVWAEEAQEAAAAPQEEAPKEEPKKEEKKEEPKKEEPKEEPKQEEKKEEPKEEPKKEEKKEESKQEETPKEEPKEEPKDTPKEEPKEEPKQEPSQDTPSEEEKGEETPSATEGQDPEPVHSDDPSDGGEKTDGKTPEGGKETEAPADDGETETPTQEEKTPEDTATPEPTPQAPAAEIASLSASTGVVMLGGSIEFSFSVRNASKLGYRLVDPSGVSSGGSLSADASRFTTNATKEGKYTFVLTAVGASGDETSASTSVRSVDAPALTLSVKPNAPSCHGGDPIGFTLSVPEKLELSKVSIKAVLGKKKFFESEEFTRNLTVTPPAKGKVSEVTVSVSVTDVFGRTAEKSATIPCAVHDAESRAHWEATMKGVKKTGVWPDDLIAIAKTQIGYKESSKDFGPKYDGGISGYTRYGDWAGMPYEEWCAMFACFCLHYAGIEEENFPYASNCQRWIKALKKVKLYAASGTYTPKVGDLAFFDWENDNDSDHVGIIFALDTNKKGEVVGIRTIEGNSKGAAVYDGKYYKLGDHSLIGYGLVNGAYDREIEKQHRDLSAEFEGFTVDVGVEPEAKLPAHAALDAREILPGDADYDRLLAELRGGLTGEDLVCARFLKIGFVNEDSTPVALQAPVALKVSFKGKLVGGKDFAPGVAVMSQPMRIDTDVVLERKKQSFAFSFTQPVDDVLCLFATGALKYKDGSLKATGNNQSVSVSYTAEAMVPDGAVLDFHEIKAKTEAYEACRAALGEAWPQEKGVTVRVFAVDVTLNGVPIRPATPVSVKLDGYQKGYSAELLRVDDGAELVCESTRRKSGRLTVDFNADRFGTFAVAYATKK